MKKLIILFASVFCSLTIEAQVVLKGIAVKMNSSFTPVTGVEIIAQSSTPTLTDGAGAFVLQLPNMEPGDLMFDIQIHKRGMEIVNQKEIEQWVASEDILYKVVLCPAGYIEENKRKFYNIGKSHYQKEYERKLSEIKMEQDKQKTDAQSFQLVMDSLNQEYDKRMKLLDYYADKFARINKDELSEMEKRAISLVEEGNIDGAIRVYEESGIVEQFSKKIAQRDSLNHSIQVTGRLIRQQIEWYEKEGSPASITKSEQLKHVLKRIDNTNL